MGFESIDHPSPPQEVERNPKISISHFLAGEGWQMVFESIDQPGRSSEVEHNPKTSISFFWLERGGGRGSSPLTSSADHQNQNVMLTGYPTFSFLGGGGGTSSRTKMSC